MRCGVKFAQSRRHKDAEKRSLRVSSGAEPLGKRNLIISRVIFTQQNLSVIRE